MAFSRWSKDSNIYCYESRENLIVHLDDDGSELVKNQKLSFDYDETELKYSNTIKFVLYSYDDVYDLLIELEDLGVKVTKSLLNSIYGNL